MKIAIISDIHEDIISLKEALRKIEKLKCDEIVCLGDISGFSIPYNSYFQTRNAHECLKLIRSNCKIVILGNHDFHAASIIPENCSFFDFPNNWYEMDYQQRQKLSDDSIWLHEENDLNPLYTEEDLNYLKSLPEYAAVDYSGINILFSHYVYPNISGLKKGFYTFGNEFQDHHKFMKSQACSLSFTGHSHIGGFYFATKEGYKEFRYKGLKLTRNITEEPICIGIPPLSSQHKKNGFCIFDLDELFFKAVKL